jgi:hypothetical protein
MNRYNVTAQVYNKLDNDKQTLLMNEVISASSNQEAIESFKQIYSIDHEVVKIYSAENV